MADVKKFKCPDCRREITVLSTDGLQFSRVLVSDGSKKRDVNDSLVFDVTFYEGEPNVVKAVHISDADEDEFERFFFAAVVHNHIAREINRFLSDPEGYSAPNDDYDTELSFSCPHCHEDLTNQVLNQADDDGDDEDRDPEIVDAENNHGQDVVFDDTDDIFSRLKDDDS